MDLKEARNIAGEYGGFLSCANERLGAIFFTHIPQSLLPFQPAQIEEALDVVAKFYYENGDQKKVRLYQEVKAELGVYKNDEESILYALKMYNEKKWLDFVMETIKNFRNSPAQINYISEFFNDTPLEKIDFANLDFSTAHKIIAIYNLYLKNAHMRLNYIFRGQIPESLLPFPKKYILKALDEYAEKHKLLGDTASAYLFTASKTILDEDYVIDGMAMSELIVNFSNKKIRDSIIFNLRELQLKASHSEYIDFPGLKIVYQNLEL